MAGRKTERIVKTRKIKKAVAGYKMLSSFFALLKKFYINII